MTTHSTEVRLALLEDADKHLGKEVSSLSVTVEELKAFMHKTIGRQTVLLYIPVVLQCVVGVAVLWEKLG
jgi:hypothetical protein